LLEVNGNEEYQNTVIRAGVALFGIDTGLISIYRNEEYVEFYCYSIPVRVRSVSLPLKTSNRFFLLSIILRKGATV